MVGRQYDPEQRRTAAMPHSTALPPVLRPLPATHGITWNTQQLPHHGMPCDSNIKSHTMSHTYRRKHQGGGGAGGPPAHARRPPCEAPGREGCAAGEAAARGTDEAAAEPAGAPHAGCLRFQGWRWARVKCELGVVLQGATCAMPAPSGSCGWCSTAVYGVGAQGAPPARPMCASCSMSMACSIGCSTPLHPPCIDRCTRRRWRTWTAWSLRWRSSSACKPPQRRQAARERAPTGVLHGCMRMVGNVRHAVPALGGVLLQRCTPHRWCRPRPQLGLVHATTTSPSLCCGPLPLTHTPFGALVPPS